MFFKDIYTSMRLGFLALLESVMSSNPPSNARYLFGVSSRRIDVENWADHALREEFFDYSTSSSITTLTYCKATGGKNHEFVLLEIQTPDGTSHLMIDREPTTHPKSSSSPLPSIAPIATSSKIASGRRVPADDNVWVPEKGGEATLCKWVFHEHGKYRIVSQLTWADSQPTMSAAQLSILLRAIHEHSQFYHAKSNSCYWFAFTIMEVIRGKFPGIHTEGPAFKDRGEYLGWSADLEDAVATVSGLYDAAWVECAGQAQRRAVSYIDLCALSLRFLKFDRMRHRKICGLLQQQRQTVKRDGRPKQRGN